MLDTTTRTAAIARLRELLGDRLSTALAVRTQHADDPTWHDARPADAVAFPESEQEVAAIVRICAAHQLPVIPYGVGTSLEGHIAAPEGGVCIDLSRLNRVIAVNAQDMDCVVEPGVTRRQLNSHLRDTGLFFPVDPGADATIGGMAATRASGTNAVRFGTMAENVRSMRVVLASGEIIDTARRARKSAAGYDLTRLFIGSEGTLGVFTRLTLKLSPIPEAVIAGVLAFPSVRAACEAVIATIQSALPVARIELLDAETIATLNTYSKLAMPERPTLFIEFHGSPAGIHERRETFMALAGEFGVEALQWASRPEERHRLWRARHDAFWAAKAAWPGQLAMTTDVCVPISHLADIVAWTRAEMEREGLVGPIVGHVGDGNFHVITFSPPDDAARKRRIEDFAERLAERAIAVGGTCTGEHGVGLGKRHLLAKEHGGAIALMRAVKRALDPAGIMNPGKMLPPD